MLPEDPWTKWWIKAIAYGLFAAFGGIMGHLLRTMDNAESIHWGRTVLQGSAAGFVGLLVFLACKAMLLSEEWTAVIVGVCGWLGANATIKMFEKLVFKKFGIDAPDRGADREP